MHAKHMCQSHKAKLHEPSFQPCSDISKRDCYNSLHQSLMVHVCYQSRTWNTIIILHSRLSVSLLVTLLDLKPGRRVWWWLNRREPKSPWRKWPLCIYTQKNSAKRLAFERLFSFFPKACVFCSLHPSPLRSVNCRWMAAFTFHTSFRTALPTISIRTSSGGSLLPPPHSSSFDPHENVVHMERVDSWVVL